MVAISVTSGSHVRRDCFPDSRAVARQRASDFAARSPRQVPTQRAAAQGTILSTPTSVSTSTASSARSPLGIACTTVTTGVGAGRTETSETEADNDDFEVSVTVQVADVPAPSTSTTCSPTLVRRTTTACRASGPVSVTRSPAPTPVTGPRKTGSVIVGPKASLSRPNTDFCGELIRPSGDSSWRSWASSRSSCCWRSSRRPGVSTSTVTTRSPRTCERRCGTPRPRSVVSVPDWVPGRISRSTHSSTSESGSATSASSRGSWIVVPSAAAVIGTVTWQRRSVPSRVNTGWVATWIST